MCWFHLIQAVITRNPFRMPQAVQTSVRKDLDVMHNSPSSESFHSAYAIIDKKWESIASLNSPSSEHGNMSFRVYFNKNWIQKCSEWALCAMKGELPCVSTNNGTESFNHHGIHV